MGGRAQLGEARRVVVKLGTHVVTHDGVEFALGRVASLVESVARLAHDGAQPLLVSSGAIGLGMRVLGLEERPTSLGLRQACAAVGQGQLVGLYTQDFAQLGVKAAQVLLTQEDLADPDRALCLRTTLVRLIELGVVPILNENDSVSVRELVEYWRTQGESEAPSVGFGDNDGLSARVAVSLDADLLVLLTDVDGVYTANPNEDPNAERLPELFEIDLNSIRGLATRSAGGTGGMASKLEAARIASEGGVSVLILDGNMPHVLNRALAGEDVGTLIPAATRRPARLREIALSEKISGALVVNRGAASALQAQKASLLPVGVVGVEGSFVKGDVVEIRDGSGRILGRGLVNYGSSACRRLAGKQSEQIHDILGWRGYDELVTRDNMVVGEV
jgi:glutamate 5-kinase